MKIKVGTILTRQSLKNLPKISLEVLIMNPIEDCNEYQEYRAKEWRERLKKYEENEKDLFLSQM